MKKIQQNEKTNEIYLKKFKLGPNLDKEFQIMWE
jgi:hypothetical protein